MKILDNHIIDWIKKFSTQTSTISLKNEMCPKVFSLGLHWQMEGQNKLEQFSLENGISVK